ncbi:hypothetical protein CHRYSEO8AT_60034 [Chryseobacterium sp. 8AT]|nr:hypothetical protein CHRYSEO8AT_60034 [Chryseobacterium sp. 8AT]
MKYKNKNILLCNINETVGNWYFYLQFFIKEQSLKAVNTLKNLYEQYKLIFVNNLLNVIEKASYKWSCLDL